MKLRRYQKGMGRQKVRANVHVSRDENKKRAQRGNLEGKRKFIVSYGYCKWGRISRVQSF